MLDMMLCLCLMRRRPTRSNSTDTLLPYTRLFRSLADRHPADLEPFGQLALAGQPGSGRVGSVQNQAPDRVGDILEKAAFGHGQSSPHIGVWKSIQSGRTSLKPMTEVSLRSA